MWEDAFQVSTQRVTYALLCGSVLPSGGKPFEKVSAAIAVRTALNARVAKQTLLFLVPEVTATTARHIAAALLVGNHAHSGGHGELPPAEVHPLFKGDLLFVTPAVSDSKGELQEVPIAQYQRLKEYWDVIAFSKYTGRKADKPRVFLANPGWMLAGTAGRRFGAVVIDASHPRTIEKLPELLAAARGCSSIRIAVAPPIAHLNPAFGNPAQTFVWVWDPQAIKDAVAAVDGKSPLDSNAGKGAERVLWVCDSDAAGAKALAELHRQLVKASRAAAGRAYPGIQLCWSIYNRLRQLLVPLAQLEQVSANTWSGNLRVRVDALADVQGHGDVAWDTTWPELRDVTRAAYQTFLEREQTAKFWGVASSVETFIASGAAHLRVVIGSEAESELFLEMLGDVVDGVREAMVKGRLEVVSSRQEANLVAEGHISPTVLLGPRMNGHRYLDVFASQRIDEFVYPHEVDIEQAAQVRLYGSLSSAMTDESRVGLLAPLGLRPPPNSPKAAPYLRPDLTVQTTDGHTIKATKTADVANDLDIDALTEGLGWAQSEGNGHGQQGISVQGGDVVEITFTRGDSANYYASQGIDVVFSETGTVQRVPAASVRPGWQIISFVDGRYDGLFKRLTEVVNSRLKPEQRVALELWQRTKAGLVSKHSNKRALYEKLRDAGLQSGYETFASWLREGDEGVLAPQQYEEFEILAMESPTYNSPSLLKATFAAVQHDRGRSRASGRLLRRFLREIVTGEDGYDEALESVRQLDTALADVLAAVEILDVKSLQAIKRSH